MQARKAFGMDHKEITDLAASEQPGAEGVNFLPFLTGERSPNWPDSYGVLTGLRPGALKPGRLYRAALEGATFPLLYGKSNEAQACRHKSLRLNLKQYPSLDPCSRLYHSDKCRDLGSLHSRAISGHAS